MTAEAIPVRVLSVLPGDGMTTPTPREEVLPSPHRTTSSLVAEEVVSAFGHAGASGPSAASSTRRHAAAARLWGDAIVLSPADQAWLERRLPRTAYVRIGRGR